MKRKITAFFILVLISYSVYAGVVYYGTGRAVFLENIIQFANFLEIEATGIKNLRVGGELAAHNVQAANVDKNFLPFGAFETGDEDFTSYVDAAGQSPVDGTGGGPSSFLTCAQSSTTPLEGNGSLNMVKFNASSGGQGHGCSYDFTIPEGMAGKPFQLSFKYLFDDVDASNGDFGVFIYDITNGNFLTLSSSSINKATYINYFNAMFTTVATSYNYRIIFHLKYSRVNVFNLKIDNLTIKSSIDQNFRNTYFSISTLNQTVIALGFPVDQYNKKSFMLFVDGILFNEGSSYDYTFTNVVDNYSNAVTLKNAIPAGLTLRAIY